MTPPNDKPIMQEKHFRTGVVVIGWCDMKELAIAEAMRRAGITDRSRIKADTRYEDATEGSPAYRVGTQVVVTLTEDMMEAPHDPAR
jgi:hypothetical protein